LSLIVVVVVGASALAIATLGRSVRFREFIRLHCLAGVNNGELRSLLDSSRYIAALILGTVTGMAVFAPLSLHIYLKHQFPLLAAPVHVAQAIIFTLLAYVFFRQISWKRWITFVAMCLLVFDHLVVQINDWRASSPTDLSWISFVSARKEATFAISATPSWWVSLFTSKPEGGVATEKDREIVQRLNAVERPLNLAEYFRFMVRDPKTDIEAYRQADFWIYVPLSSMPQFDLPSPACRTDYLQGLANRLRTDYLLALVNRFLHRRLNAAPTGTILGLWPTRIRPGNIVSITGQIQESGATVAKVQLVDHGRLVGDLIFNCQYQTFQGTYRIPADATLGAITLQVRVVGNNGQASVISELHLTIDPNAPPPPYPPLSGRMPAPSIDQVIEAAGKRSINIIERGMGYVILDLRPFRATPP